MSTPPLAAHSSALIEANGFDPGTLETNRSGRLTPAQIARLRSRRRARGWALLLVGALCIVLGISHLTTSGDDPWGAAMAVAFGGVLIALRWTDFGVSYAAELKEGRVATLDGRIVVHAISGDSHTAYYYRLGEREFQTTEEGAKEIDPKARYRIYHLPNSNEMVNIEVLSVPGPHRGR